MKSLRIFWFFCLAVGILVFTASLFKAVTVVLKSKFDGHHRFTLLITQKPIRVMSVSPETKSLALLTVTDMNSVLEKRIEKELGLPIDAQVTSKNAVFQEGDSIEKVLERTVFQFPQIQTEMTYIDAIRIWLFARGVDPHAISSETIMLKDVPTAVVDKTVNTLFSDPSVVRENVSIQIMNGTGVEGMGTSFARQISNIGGNVVAVTTSTKPSNKNKISYYMNSSYTVRKLEKLLNTKAVSLQKRGISDIIVILGKESVK